ncbi:hypothetical protein NXH64_07910 [Butyrivibrio fibrisolvens]|uniref:hypothetical protein n=1 Tax=Pseudobutyrivibrio ruminis TaxID=46206 RepID=UPI000417A27D|nr:hypothetical protein [Pseudobutyrivibrio ruminis]MDC7279428.1 hypothetical protein [Butyrivibrio fibrisolvens]
MGKKVIKVLKGVAITGSAAAGVSVLGDANLAYAQSLEENVVEQTLEETVVETTLEVQTELNQFNTYTYETVESAEEAIAEAEVQITETEAEKAEAVAEMESVQQEIDLSVEEQASVQSQLDTAVNEKATLQQEMADRKEAYEEAGYATAGLDEQQVVVDEKIIEETAVRTQLDEANKDLTVDNYYKNQGRVLAKDMILYKLILTGEVSAEDADKVVFGENFNHDYVGKHYCVKYVKIIDGEPVYIERYFDYVTCDEEGNSLYQGLVENENDSSIVAGINVVEKTPTYKVWKEDSHKVSTYDKNVTGMIKNQKVFGYTFHAAQRDEQAGWYAEEGQQAKGVEWYTQKQYQQDAANRNEYKDFVETATTTISTLDEKIAELTATLSNITNQINYLCEDIEDIQVEIQEYDNKIKYLKDKVDALGDRIQEIMAGQQAQQVKNDVTTPVAATRTIEEAAVPAYVQTIQPVQAIQPVQTIQPIQSIQEVQVPLAVVDVEMEDDVVETVTIQEQEVAMAGENTRHMAVWNGSTLPLLGAIAGFIGITKVKRNEN